MTVTGMIVSDYDESQVNRFVQWGNCPACDKHMLMRVSELKCEEHEEVEYVCRYCGEVFMVRKEVVSISAVTIKNRKG